ncbi:hypothetical protein I350_07725 [Cryptococcus amylolentus CBS 6273]|uniref:Ribosomal RNA-processing protein 1 n=1 Tax=Cryptococcus amylolentus CBS 6273 TaxID=1296118 RepID=A0A1E3JB36_9TREE|nr:hypothetical protein I350_07725 [Cryptococcus amylolentus CBS 6273]
MPAPSNRKGKSRATEEETVQAALPLGKQLAHTDKKVRDRAIAGLVAFVSQGSGEEEGSKYVPLEDKEMAKLWKGLFYCAPGFWMSDKPLVQQALATSLSDLLLLIAPSNPSDTFPAALAFLAGFWQAIVREWTGIDRLRMDKYYMLTRKYVNVTFRLLAREQWKEEKVAAVNDVLMKKGGPVGWEDRSVPESLANHLSDIYLEELDKVLALPEVTSQPPCPLAALLTPHTILLARTPTKTVHTRLMSSLFTPILTSLSLASSTPVADSERPAKRTKKEEPMYAHIVMHSTAKVGGKERSTPEELKGSVLRGMFNAAAHGGATEPNRRKIYKVWREEGGDDDDDDDEE